MIEEDHVLRPFDPLEAVTVSIAAKIAGVKPRTMQSWAAEKGIGRKVGGHWRISRVALAMYCDGDMAALRAYQRGDRTSERVARYFVRAGIKTPQNAQNAQNRYGVAASGAE